MTITDPLPNTALVTGAGKRIGRQIALRLADKGWNIAIHYLSGEQDAFQTLEDVRAKGVNAIALKADLMNAEQTRRLISDCAEQFAVPTCLVNNGSIFNYDDLATFTDESWAEHLTINLKAPVQLAQCFAQHLPQNIDGNIINIIDQRVWKLTPQYFSYTISKSALWTATKTMAQALAPNIRVNAIGPGPVLRNHLQNQKQFSAEKEATILRRGASADEIANAVCFILETPSLTGQMIALDGGQHLAWQTPDIVAQD